MELEQEDRGKGRAGWSEWGKHVGLTSNESTVSHPKWERFNLRGKCVEQVL